ncbi:MAG: PorV/PorQ family protein [Methanococcaceae archaeon]
MKNKLFNILFLLVILSVQMYAQLYVSDVSKKGTTAAPFLSIPQGAKASAMGGAFVSVADDPSAMFWNPAGLTKVEGMGVMFDHTEWIADVRFNYIAASYSLGDLGNVGVSFTSSDIGEMGVTTIDEPEGTGEVFKASDVAVNLAYAIKLTDNFAIGISPKFISQSIWRMSATGFAMDLGVQYTTPFDGIILGMSISNFGSKMQLNGNSTLTLIQIGEDTKVPAYLQTEEWALPLNFRVGLAYQPIRTGQHKVTLALDAQHPNDNYESVNVGAEYMFNDFIAFRGGYNSLFLKESEQSFALGFGLKQALLDNVVVRVDYSYQKFGRLTNVQKFTLGINF